jgi:integrase
VWLSRIRLDHYKSFTDRYGHQVGDVCLRAVAVVVRETVQAVGIACRYDGEEIAVTLSRRRPDDRVAERILDEKQVFALLDSVEDHPRDHALIRLLYNGGLRVSEAVTLQWRNLVNGIVNNRGKGGRTHMVRLSRGTWAELQALRPANALDDNRVFPMTGSNAWIGYAARHARPASRRWSHRTSYATRTGPMPCAGRTRRKSRFRYVLLFTSPSKAAS